MTHLRLALATGALLAALPCATAFAQTPAPVNDNYLSSIPFNESGQAGDPPPTGSELEHNPDTTAATEQGDLFNPRSDGSPGSGGGAETLACDGTPFGKTVWYDVYPSRNGNLRVLAVGSFDPVIAIYPFDASGNAPPIPDVNNAQCANLRTGPTEEMIIGIRGGRAYTIQIGGVGGAGGPAQNTFGFFPSQTPRIDADATLRATATGSGIRVTSLRVDAPRGSSIAVTCTRGGCRKQTLKASHDSPLTLPIGPVSPAAAPKGGRTAAASSAGPRAESSRVRSIRNVRGRSLTAGSKLIIRVTRRGYIGKYIQYTIRRGNFRKIERCMNPGSTRPRTRCSG